jgi:SAM-dependent methyltransferase
MGFVRGNMLPLLKEGVRKPFGGKLLLLGQGDIYFDLHHLKRMATIAGFTLDDSVPVAPSHNPAFAAKGHPHCQTVFKMLGFESISVLDFSAFEGADVVHDLNQELPEELHGQFDMVIDHGTLEHVFDFPTGLNNVFKLLKIGGRAHFSMPSGNFFDHGFYMLQPTLMSDWLTTNQWEINSIQVARFTPNQEIEPVWFADYEPGMFETLSYGRMDNCLYSTQATATKTAESTGDFIPQQGAYARLPGWQSPVADAPALPSLPPKRRLLTRIAGKAKRMAQAIARI